MHHQKRPAYRGRRGGASSRSTSDQDGKRTRASQRCGAFILAGARVLVLPGIGIQILQVHRAFPFFNSAHGSIKGELWFVVICMIDLRHAKGDTSIVTQGLGGRGGVHLW